MKVRHQERKKRESPSLVPGKAKKAGLYTQSNWRVLTKGRGEKINKTEKEIQEEEEEVK
jgi:hypothetical protein